MVWGLKHQDRRACHMTDFKCTGTTVFDDSFDMNPPPCQLAMLVSFHRIDHNVTYVPKVLHILLGLPAKL